MNTIENRLKYYELLMVYDDTSKRKIYNLPEGYRFEFYKPGDENEWVNIHISSGEFTSIEKGLQYFRDFYNHFITDLNRRCLFIVKDDTLEKVGTATISLLKQKEYGYEAAVDWVAIKKEYQGLGLSKPLICRFLQLADELGHKRIILHTQTTTWLAAKLYLDFGFKPLNIEKSKFGWQILKTITNHEKLKELNNVSKDEMYDKRNVIIYNKLKHIYGDNFNYNVWYKNGLHNVYVYSNGSSDEYEYFEEDNDIRLEKINKGDKVKKINYKFRNINEKDYNFIYELKKNAYKKYVELNWGSWEEEKQKVYFEKFIDRYKDGTFIITLDGQDIGFYNGEILENGNYEIGNICIIPKYQGKGIGTTILNDILDKYNNRNITIQYFKQNPVGNLYKRLGFVSVGETEYHYQMIKEKVI